GGGLEEQALGAFAGADRRARVPALADELGGLEIQPALGFRRVMTSQAIVFENGQNFFLEIDGQRRLALESGHRQSRRLSRLRFGRFVGGTNPGQEQARQDHAQDRSRATWSSGRIPPWPSRCGRDMGQGAKLRACGGSGHLLLACSTGVTFTKIGTEWT